jgi:shikimate kinase
VKIVYILIGLKGSGKTHIGNLLSQRLAIPFLRVEDLFLRIKTENPLEDQNYISTGYKNVENEIRERLSNSNQIAIESTGIASKFHEMILRLKNDYSVKLIKIESDPELCLKRIENRDQSIHISVSDDKINEINKLAQTLSLNFDLVINNNSKTDDELIQEFKKIK